MAVDVIVPTYNRPGFLARALASIRAQTYQDYEIMVVNDGGEDVRQLCQLFGAMYMKHSENRGLPAARNTGIRATNCKLVAYLDDDDMWLPEHLEKLARLYENTQARLVYSNSYYWFDERGYDVMLNEDPDKEKLLERNMTPVCSVMHERSLFFEAGGFDETLKNHEDYDLWLRMREICDFAHLREVTALYSKRSGSDQMSMNPRPMRDGKDVVQRRHRERIRL